MICLKHHKNGKQKNWRSMVLLNSCAAVFVAIGLGGCMDLYEPSKINQRPIQVREEAFNQDVLISDVDEQYIRALAHHYKRYGASKMDLLLTYDPYSKDFGAMMAGNKVAEIKSYLRDMFDIKKVEASIMPIVSRGDRPRLMVSYSSLNAYAPKGCEGMMPGINGRPMEGDSRYKLGCSIATLKTRQVVRPADLMGRGVDRPSTEGRSASNIVDYYRSGAQNEPLGGERASED